MRKAFLVYVVTALAVVEHVFAENDEITSTGYGSGADQAANDDAVKGETIIYAAPNSLKETNDDIQTNSADNEGRDDDDDEYENSDADDDSDEEKTVDGEDENDGEDSTASKPAATAGSEGKAYSKVTIP